MPLRFCMGPGEGTNGVEAPPASSTPSQHPATQAVPPSASPDVGGATTQDSDNNANDTVAPAGDQEQQPNQEAETAGNGHGAGGTEAQAEEPEQPTPGTDDAAWPATPPEARTPERDVAPAPRTGDHGAQAAETEPDVETVKPEPGCTTPPPPPAHDSEGSDMQSADGHGSPLHGEKPRHQAGAGVMRDMAASSKSRLLAFRSFSRDKKVVKHGGADTASPERREAGGEGAEHKEKGKERRKRFWK